MLGGSLGCTHNLENVDLAIDTDLPDFRVHILVIADEGNELDVGSRGSSEWLELWARNSGKRESLDPHLVRDGRIVWSWNQLERQRRMER